MKKANHTQIAIIFLAIITCSLSCKKNTDPVEQPKEINLPGVMMTLSAISYVADSFPAIVIKDSIKYFLGIDSLATHGDWKLVWGPGISPLKENLVYVTKNSTGDVPAYAIAIRGTNVFSPGDDLQDFDVFTLVHFKYGKPEDMVSRGAMDGLNNLLATTDPANGSILEDYLFSIITDTRLPLFVTGHSQGGSLAPLMTYWLLTNTKFTGKFTISTLAFAGPAVVNQSFQTNFLAALPDDASFQMRVNTKDVVPYYWANLPAILSGQVPVHVPFLHKTLIHGFDTSLQAKGIKYYNIVVSDTIGHIPVTNNVPGITPADSIRWYDHWLETEHNHNNYLKLLGVATL